MDDRVQVCLDTADAMKAEHGWQSSREDLAVAVAHGSRGSTRWLAPSSTTERDGHERHVRGNAPLPSRRPHRPPLHSQGDQEVEGMLVLRHRSHCCEGCLGGTGAYQTWPLPCLRTTHHPRDRAGATPPQARRLRRRTITDHCSACRWWLTSDISEERPA